MPLRLQCTMLEKTDIAYSARQWFLFGLLVVHVPSGEQLNGPCSLIEGYSAWQS